MKKGFTLIEVIVAIAAIAMIILAISGLTSISIKMNREVDRRDEGFNIARSICEIYRSDSNVYSNTGTEINIYKYINNLLEVPSINSIIENRDGEWCQANYEEIINSNSGFKYTLVLKIRRLQNIEEMEGLWIEVIRNDNRLIRVKMNIAK